MRNPAMPGVDAAPPFVPTPQQPLRVPAWFAWAFTMAVAFTYFAFLGQFALAEPDEPRYAEIAREMLVLRDWVTPHLNFVKYFEKPPLVYWLTAINFAAFGMSEFVVRLWPALFGVTGIVVAYALGRTMYGAWTGCAAAALLATTPFYFGLSQITILDMPLSALMAVGLGCFWLAYRKPRHRRLFVLLMYAATALGVLTKGPVAALLTGGIVVVFVGLRGDVGALRWVLSPLGVLLFLLIALPWFVLVSQRNPEFLEFFVVKQHVARFLQPDEHRQGVWFFVPIVFGSMLPWTGFAALSPRSVAQFVMRLLQRRVSPAALFCVVWAGVVFVFFSLSGSKLATYVLPMFCPLAILAARLFQQAIQEHRAEVFARGCIGLLVLAAVAMVAAKITAEVVDIEMVGAIIPRAYLGACVLAGFAGAGLACSRRRPQASFAAVLLGMLSLQAVAMSGRGVATHYRPLGDTIRAQAAPDDLVVVYQHYVQGVTFYARRRTVLATGRGELDFGSRQGDQHDFFWDTDAELLEAWQSGRRIFLVINRSELEPLRPQMRPLPRQIAAYGKKVIVVNFE